MSRDAGFRFSKDDSLLVLYVGDANSNFRLHKLALEQRGYSITTASSTSQALQLFSVTDFDVVISEFVGEAAAEMVAEMKRRDSRILVIGLSADPRRGEGTFDAWVTDDDSPYRLWTKIEAMVGGGHHKRFKTEDAFPRSFAGASKSLEPLLKVIVGAPDIHLVQVTARRAETAETELREFEQEMAACLNQPRSSVLSGVAERIRLAFCADGAAIAFLAPQGLLCEASTGAAPAVGARLASNSRLTKECVEDGRIVLCDDAEHDPRISPFLAKSLKFRSAVAVPIEGWSSIVGVVEVFSSRTYAFDATHVVRLARIARLLVPFAAALQHEQTEESAPVATSGSLGWHVFQWPWVAAGAGLALVVMALLFATLRVDHMATNPETALRKIPGVGAIAPNSPQSVPRGPVVAAVPPFSRTDTSGIRRVGRAREQTSETPVSRPKLILVPPPALAPSVDTTPAPPVVVEHSSPGAASVADAESGSSGLAKKADKTEIAAAIRPEPEPVGLASPDFVLDHTLRGHSSWVTGVAFSAEGNRLASASWDRSVKFWDVPTGRELGTVAGDGERIQALTFSRDGHWLAAENSDNTVTLWNAYTRQEARTLPGDKPPTPYGSNWVYSIAFSPDGRWLASAVDDRTVRLWDVKTGRAVRDLSGSRRSVIYIAFSPDGRLLASGKDDKTINIWDVESGRVLHTLSGHKKNIYAVAFSPDGRWLASASEDKSVKLWDVATGTELRDLKGHRARVTTLAFSPDGRWLASGSWDKTVRIWDAASGRELETLSGNTHDIYTVAFGSRGRWLASGSEDGIVKLWRLKGLAPSAD